MSIRRMSARIAQGLAACLLLTLPALGAGLEPCLIDPALGLTAQDAQRLAGLEQSRAKGLAANEKEGNPAVGKVLAGIYDAGLVPLATVTPGTYRCRTIKLGSQDDGPPMSTVYGYFTCKIAKAADGWSLAKTTGSQNFTGMLTPAGDGLIYEGASNYGYEPPRKYGDKADENQVGCMYGIADDPRHYVLELPFPALESLHDVIEFRPAK